MVKYLLDTNIFIQSDKVSYPIDVFPSLWDWLDSELSKGEIASIRLVADEILKGNDDLSIRVKRIKSSKCFHALDDLETQEKFKQISEWANSSARKYNALAKKVFLSNADSWLIAKAAAIGAKIVTYETSSKESINSIKIPDVANVFGVNCINIVDLLRERNIKF